MEPTIYLFFKGNCLEALTHYAETLGDAGARRCARIADGRCGIAIGAGTGVAVGRVTWCSSGRTPRDVARIVALSRASYRKMVQKLWWAAGYNISPIPLAAGVLAWAGIILAHAIGAVLMSASGSWRSTFVEPLVSSAARPCSRVSAPPLRRAACGAPRRGATRACDCPA
jgi:hypothetical protein